MLISGLDRFMRAYRDIQLELILTKGWRRHRRKVRRGGPRGRMADSRPDGAPLGIFACSCSALLIFARRGTPRSYDLFGHAAFCTDMPITASSNDGRCRRAQDLDMESAQTAVLSTIEPLIYIAEIGIASCRTSPFGTS